MHRLTLAGLLPVLFAAPGGAPGPPTITEDEFLAVLDESHPAVRDSSEALAVARARVVEASTLENPVIGVEREDPSGAGEQTDWTISWQLPEAGRRREIGARAEEADAVATRLSQQLLALRLTLRGVYAEWALAEARQARLSAQAGRVEALAVRETARAERGEISGLESHRLVLAATALRARVALAAAAAERARAGAAGWLPALPPEARPILPAVPAPPELGSFHPLVRAAEADLAATILNREAAGRFVASPELSVGWQRLDVGPESIAGPLLGLAWSVPVFDRNRAGKAASEARVSGARARLERVRRELDASRTAAGTTFERLVRALDAAEAALARNERMLDGAEAAFRQGEAGLTDLLETHRSVTEAELAVLDVHEAALAAHRELERLAGAGGATGDPPIPSPRENVR
jgi:cobalt-zinc-cadmium efflux system outer membrane protein